MANELLDITIWSFMKINHFLLHFGAVYDSIFELPNNFVLVYNEYAHMHTKSLL